MAQQAAGLGRLGFGATTLLLAARPFLIRQELRPCLDRLLFNFQT
jgi:hypothetical protein